MPLEPIDILNGFLTLTFVIISTYVGLKIAMKYFERKQRQFLLVGITWVGIVSPWWPSTVSFFIALFTGGDGLYSYPKIYFIIGNVLIPFFILTWMIAITDFLYKDKQKVILSLFIIYGAVFEIIFFYFLFTNSALIGELHGAIDVEYQSIIRIYLLSVVAIILITGIRFGYESRKSDNPTVHLQGNLIIIGIISWCIGAVLDAAIPLDLITLSITRILLITSAIEFYGGFILPKWLKRLILKKENQ